MNIEKVHSGQWEKIVVARILTDITTMDLFPELGEHFIHTGKKKLKFTLCAS